MLRELLTYILPNVTFFESIINSFRRRQSGLNNWAFPGFSRTVCSLTQTRFGAFRESSAARLEDLAYAMNFAI